MKILLATNNAGKVARVRTMLVDRVECFTPTDLGILPCDVEEGSDILENAKAKARPYFGLTRFPILGMDTAFVIPGENLDPARVRRNALEGRDEASMSKEEIVEALISFYRALVERRGGPVPGYWIDVFALLTPNGEVHHETSHRDVILTGETRGEVNQNFPMRAMYISPLTRKYVAEQTPEEQAIEMRPYQAALERLLGLASHE